MANIKLNSSSKQFHLIIKLTSEASTLTLKQLNNGHAGTVTSNNFNNFN